MTELAKRVSVAVIGIPFSIAVIAFGDFVFSAVILIIAFLGVGEYANLVNKKSSKIQTIPAYIFTILLIAIFSLLLTPEKLSLSLMIYLISLILFVYSYQVFRNVNGAIFDISTTVNAALYIGIGFSSLIIIRNFNKLLLNWRDIFSQDSFFYKPEFSESHTWGLIFLFVFISIWTCDSAAYFIGKSYGKHKLHPEVSPKKSWEGAIAGLVGSIVVFTLLNYFLISNIPIIFSIVCGMLIGITGQIGDLAESQLKRDAGIKDSSNLLPGHGGILDRFDSALFVFPVLVVYFIITCIF